MNTYIMGLLLLYFFSSFNAGIDFSRQNLMSDVRFWRLKSTPPFTRVNRAHFWYWRVIFYFLLVFVVIFTYSNMSDQAFIPLSPFLAGLGYRQKNFTYQSTAQILEDNLHRPKRVLNVHVYIQFLPIKSGFR